MKNLLRTLCLVGLSALATSAYAQSESYQLPPKEVKAIVDAKPVPTAILGSDHNKMVILHRNSAFLTLEDIAYNEYRLAGVRMNPKNFSITRQNYTDEIEIVVNGKKLNIINIPRGAKISNIKWSPSDKYVVFTNTKEDEIELWRVDVASGEAKKINTYALNATTLRSVYQFLDDERILYAAVPTTVGSEPDVKRLVSGPSVQQVYGKKFGGRTMADVINNPAEEDMFEHLATSQLVIFSPEGTTKIANPAIYSLVNLSPDSKYAMVNTVHKPYSYITAFSSFPSKSVIMDMANGNIVKMLEDKTIEEPKSDKKTPKPSGYAWRADMPSTLYWSERAIDEKKKDDDDDAKDDADDKDKDNKDKEEKKFQTSIFQVSAPFTGEKQLVLKSEYGFRGITWGNETFAIYNDSSTKQKIQRTVSFNPSAPEAAQEVLLTKSTEPDSVSNYTVYGRPYTVKNQFGENVLYIEKGLKNLYFTGSNRPNEEGVLMSFIDVLDLKTKSFKQLWLSPAPYKTSIVSIVDFKKPSALVSRQSPTTPNNFAIVNLKDNTSVELTSFVDPTPAIRELGREYVTYKRKDGVGQAALLITPKGYDKARDGRLPVFMWAYPGEYKTAVEAEKTNVHKYNFISSNSAAALALQGYAVMLDMSMFIVSEDKTKEPNDVFISQLVSNAEAAIDFVEQYGVGDRHRIGVGGHSYGAFMTAHLLSQSDLFAAGVARSGAYNRTLTPFGFQTEKREYWKNPDIYFKMSPFSYVNKLKEPILLIHGELDENSGTFPVQSQRLYQALSYLGGTSRYVVLPYETHGYKALESNYQVWWETINWLDKYVKEAKPKVKAEEKK